ncbi:MAG TPA: hypothetical protein VMD30_11890 [Tepidisphaeraceae bacterium]|nr:hypothetical protein [Tepidisphaeraceae bacterium]
MAWSILLAIWSSPIASTARILITLSMYSAGILSIYMVFRSVRKVRSIGRGVGPLFIAWFLLSAGIVGYAHGNFVSTESVAAFNIGGAAIFFGAMARVIWPKTLSRLHLQLLILSIVAPCLMAIDLIISMMHSPDYSTAPGSLIVIWFAANLVLFICVLHALWATVGQLRHDGGD